MYKVGIAGEEVIGKEVWSSPGLSHSPPMTILISFTVAAFRPLPSQVYMGGAKLQVRSLFGIIHLVKSYKLLLVLVPRLCWQNRKLLMTSF